MSKLLARLGLSPVLVYLVAGAFAVLFAYIHGYRYASARGADALFRYQTNVAQTQAIAAQMYAERLQAEMNRADTAAMQLLASRAEIERLTDQLQKRVSHVSTVYVDRPGAAPVRLPERPFTVGWVRDYNAALGLRVSDAVHPAGGAARAPGAVAAARGTDAAAELARSTVNQADVLATHHVNAATCRKAIAQLDAILRLYEERQP